MQSILRNAWLYHFVQFSSLNSLNFQLCPDSCIVSELNEKNSRNEIWIIESLKIQQVKELLQYLNRRDEFLQLHSQEHEFEQISAIQENN